MKASDMINTTITPIESSSRRGPGADKHINRDKFPELYNKVLTGKMTNAAAQRELGISKTAYRNWVREYEVINPTNNQNSNKTSLKSYPLDNDEDIKHLKDELNNKEEQIQKLSEIIKDNQDNYVEHMKQLEEQLNSKEEQIQKLQIELYHYKSREQHLETTNPTESTTQSLPIQQQSTPTTNPMTQPITPEQTISRIKSYRYIFEELYPKDNIQNNPNNLSQVETYLSDLAKDSHLDYLNDYPGFDIYEFNMFVEAYILGHKFKQEELPSNIDLQEIIDVSIDKMLEQQHKHQEHEEH